MLTVARGRGAAGPRPDNRRSGEIALAHAAACKCVTSSRLTRILAPGCVREA
jgi:hypothetical protein